MIPDDPILREMLAAAILLLMLTGLAVALWRWRRNSRMEHKSGRYRLPVRKDKGQQ